ncbi:MAG: hypothetical protein ABFS18_05030 [Thermodesulfobacteriota bacterium]
MTIINITAVAAAAPWIAYLMVRPRILTILVVLLSLFQLNWFTRYFGAPAILNRVSLGFAGLLGIRLALDFALKNSTFVNRWIILSPVLWLTCFFVLLTALSNIFNGENLLLGIFELRYYYFGFVTCFSLYFYFKNVLSISLFKKAMIWVGLTQIPLSILKWIAAEGGKTATLDSVTGSFSGYGELVACQIIAICIVLLEELTSKNKLVRLNNYFLSYLLLVPIILSKSKTATLFVVMAIGFVWLLTILEKKNLAVLIKKSVSLTMTGIIMLSSLYLFFWKTNYDINQLFEKSYIIRYLMRPSIVDHQIYMMGSDPRMGRIKAICEATRLISIKPVNLFIGFGSGATTEASFLKTNGHYFQWYGPLAGLGRNYFSKTIAELGFLGLGAFISFFTFIYIKIKNNFSYSSEINKTFSLLIFTLFLLSFYTATLSSFFFNFAFAFFLATIQTELDRTFNA